MPGLSPGPGTGPRPAKTKTTGTDKALAKEKAGKAEFMWVMPNGAKVHMKGHTAKKMARSAENLLGYNPLDLEPDEGVIQETRKVKASQLKLFPDGVN